MATRSKTGAESVGSSKEAELQLIEQKVREKEARLHEQELQLRRQCEELERAKKRVESERDELNAREDELAVREREFSKKWSDPSEAIDINIPPPDPSHGMSYMYGVNVPASRGDPRDIMQPIPKVSFREATETVPHFDGYNVPLLQFTRACRRACEIIPPSSERTLTKLLKAKLRGRAYYAVEDEPCDSITQLIDLLTRTFGSRKTIDQYRGELSNEYLKPHEHIIDYISRVKDLRTSIMDAERRAKGRLDPRFISEIDALTAKSFCAGLPLEYRQQLKPEARQDYAEAFAFAKDFAWELETDRQRSDPRARENRNSEYYRSDSIGSPLARSTPRRPDHRQRQTNPRVNFTRDNRAPQHNTYRYETQPRPNSPHENHAPRTSNREPRTNTDESRRNPSSSSNNNKFCRYCKNSGHELEECRKRQYNNARRNETGNANSPPSSSGAARTDEPRRTRPVNPINAEEASEAESQS